ncbi:MAG: hypothetical protein CL478_10285 [Acidobacteria bacterium]|nr:hypothetical protein [Acidobacteriota bacterium]
MPQSSGIEHSSIQVIQSAIRHALQVTVPIGSLEEGIETNRRRVETGWVFGFLTFDYATVVEIQTEFVAEIVNGSGRVLLKVEQGLPISDFLDPTSVSVPIDPQFENPFELLLVATMLGVQGMIVVVIARTRNQLLEGLVAILGKGEFLDVAYGVGLKDSEAQATQR